jgi:hypothetical protein
MSHAYGKVYFYDGQILHFEYNGTSDVCIPFLYNSVEELSHNWRQYKGWHYCICNRHEPVIIYTDYGAGFHWEGRACRYCMCISHGLIPDDVLTPTTKGKP